MIRENFFVCFCIISLMSCAEDTLVQSNPWDIPKPLPIQKGRYKVSFEIERDECTPSLAQTKEQNPDWPGLYTVVNYIESNRGEEVKDQIDILFPYPRGIRPIAFLPYSSKISLKETLNDSILKKSQNVYTLSNTTLVPDHLQKFYWRCLWQHPTNSLVENILIQYVSDSEFKLKLDADWIINEECIVSPDGQNFDNIMPKSSCSESYIYTYKLDDEWFCDQDCKTVSRSYPIDVHVNGITMNGYQISKIDDIACECDN